MEAEQSRITSKCCKMCFPMEAGKYSVSRLLSLLLEHSICSTTHSSPSSSESREAMSDLIKWLHHYDCDYVAPWLWLWHHDYDYVAPWLWLSKYSDGWLYTAEMTKKILMLIQECRQGQRNERKYKYIVLIIMNSTCTERRLATVKGAILLGAVHIYCQIYPANEAHEEYCKRM